MDTQTTNYNPRPKKRGPSSGAVIFLAVFFGIIGGFAGTIGTMWAINNNKINIASIGPNPSVSPGLPQNTNTKNNFFSSGSSFADIADESNDSVVNINTMKQVNDPMSMFFGGGPQQVKGLGTGVIVDKNGYILTNFHVAGDADNITVTVLKKDKNSPDKIISKQYKAAFIAGDKTEDLAVLKIQASSDLKPIVFGKSASLRPGDPVMAIGNPFGFEHTVSVGVVSALNRSLPVDESNVMRGMIQTDASINPGNSGGPLLNSRGELIGINTAVYLGQGNGPQATGIGFAIPSDRAVSVMNDLRTKGRVSHPYIGVSYQLINPELQNQLHLPVNSGIYINDSLNNSPAAKSGIKKGDCYTEIDGISLSTQNSLSEYIAKKNVGDTVTMKGMRWDGTKWGDFSTKIKMEEKPTQASKAPRKQESPNNFPFPFTLP
jgi:serine protease Do